ncbi:MAG: Eco57I restriction-modification methylase domain-containing protein [Bacteroidetes bacterium]|nr:Eco57I restriction-modification methylase domain-containing protein [Bacteroidota bacterium]
MNLNIFNTVKLFDAATNLFQQLNIKLNSTTAEPLPVKDLLKQYYKDNDTFKAIDKTYFIGIIDDTVFKATGMFDINYSYKEAIEQGDKNYNGLMLFALELKKQPTRTEISDLTRTFNRISQKMPVALVLKYTVDKEAVISIAISERFKYLQNWRKGEKAGKVIILRDIHTQNTHAGHTRILLDLVKPVAVTNYDQLHQHWLQVLDVSILNKKFFQDLANWYFWAMDNVQFPDDLEKKKDVRNATNLIRLITRVIFIWFIKEKSLVPNALFRREYIDKILKDFNKNKKSQNYYNAILQNLFFGTLNQKMEERKFAKEGDIKTNKEEYGVKNLFRYADLFNIPEKEVLALFKDVPFLNGGLFDCLDKPNEENKIVYVDGFSRNPKKQASVPDYIFFGEEKEVDLNEIYGTRNKTYKSRGLINLLESYKFTVAENTPIEEEIALDPELLGKVFENLLASYNPETQTTARKQTGSFYTPREIVNYMVDESLLEYIKQNVKNESKDFEARLRDVFSYSENPNPFSEAETKHLIEAINNCKILDPACGSGAFPMGILHKMVHILQKLDANNKLWKDLQRHKAIEETETAFNIGDKEERAKRLAEINDVFENNASDYGRKLYLIENCIYGIDIQPIAVQIAKLRFFISLVIDQKVNKSKENFGVRSLPNLETKFVAANTLISLEEPKLVTGDIFLNEVNERINNLSDSLKDLRHQYFTANKREDKIRLQKQDKKLRNLISKELEKVGHTRKNATLISSFDPYDQNISASWFNPEWMFGISGGFSVVIGNPPYIGERKNKQQFTPIQNSPSNKYYLGRMDYFYFFFHLSLDFMSNNGICSFITTNYFPTALGARKLRADLKNRSTILEIINFNEAKVFDSAAGQHNMITFFLKGKKKLKTKIITSKKEGLIQPSEIIDILNGLDKSTTEEYINENEIYDGVENYIRLGGTSKKTSPINGILDKISSKSTDLLGNICSPLIGLESSLDEVYVLSEDDVRRITKGNKTELKLIKPFFKNSDVQRYYVKKETDKYLIYVHEEIKDIKKYNGIWNYLLENSKEIKSRKGANLRGAFRRGNWWVLNTPRLDMDFKDEKIVTPYRTKELRFALSTDEWYASRDVYYIVRRKPNISLKYILAILNSKLFYHWLYNRGKRKGETLEVYAKPLKEIPIIELSKNEQQPFIEIVEEIVKLKQTNPLTNTSKLEGKIDKLVYKLYDLTEEEIKIIEGNE